MKLNAFIAGVGMTKFGKHLGRGLKSLGGEAIELALKDAGVDRAEIQAAWMANATAGLITGQECIAGQVILRGVGMGTLPVINVENACASASTAFEQAAAMVTAGLYDIVLAVGTEKLYHHDKAKSFSAFGSAVDVEMFSDIMVNLKKNAATGGAATAADDGAGKNRSMFMDIYASSARAHMKTYGTTPKQFAAVSAKNSFHGSLNANAQFTHEMTVEQVLAEPMIAEPLTRPMCSPLGDGAAAVVIVSEQRARQMGLPNPIRAVSSVLRSGWDHGPDDEVKNVSELCVQTAFEESGLGATDLSLVELHDASAPAEIMAYEYIGLCPYGEGGHLVESGQTRLGGGIPVNTSGGLLRKGHPIGASGIAQLVELTTQLRGNAGHRQVDGATVGLAHNGGGSLGTDAAAMCVTILTR